MTSLSDAIRAHRDRTGPTASRIEAAFRGEPEALKRLAQALQDAGIYVQVDREFHDIVWPDSHFVMAGLLIPGAERTGEEAPDA